MELERRSSFAVSDSWRFGWLRTSPWITWILITAGLLLLANRSDAKDPWEDRSSYRVTVDTEGDENKRKTVILHVVEKESGHIDTVRFFNQTVRVTDSFHLPRNRFLVKGQLGTGGEILSVVDLERKELIDTIWAYRSAFTHDRTKAVYRFRVPPRSVPRYIDTLSVLAYDFEKSPAENTVGDGLGNPERRGFILYPAAFREADAHFIPAGSPREQRFLRSDFVWCGDDEQVLFVDWFQGASYLVLIDISSGLASPVVQKDRIDLSPFLADKFRRRAPPEHDFARGLFVKSIEFVDDCQAVRIVSTATTILAERGVVLNTDASVKRVE